MQVLRVAAAGNAGRAWPLGHLEATGDQTTEGCFTPLPPSLNPFLFTRSVPTFTSTAGQTWWRSLQRLRRIQTAGGVNIATQVREAAIKSAALQGHCSPATSVPEPPHREGKRRVCTRTWDGLGSCWGELSCLNLCLSGGYKKTQGFEFANRTLCAQQPPEIQSEQGRKKTLHFFLCDCI